MDGLLAGKTALITGASRGIGAEIARLFAAEGASVGLFARDEGALLGVVAEIAASGGRGYALPGDLLDAGAIERAIAELAAQFGALDIAVNNASLVHLPRPLADLPVDAFDHLVAVDLRGTFVAMQAQIRALLGRGGSIVNIVSTAGVRGAAGMSAYAAAKHGVVGLTRCAALDYAAQGLRINAIAPGPIRTDRIAALTGEQRAPIERAVPMGRIGAPGDVAQAALWLASDRASFTTGAVLTVDGGRLAA